MTGNQQPAQLRDLALARSGEKGNTVFVAVVAYRSADYERLRRDVTTEVVAVAFAGVTQEPIVRYEVPNISALNFEIPGALDGGRTRNLAFDESGKCLASRLLSVPILA